MIKIKYSKENLFKKKFCLKKTIYYLMKWNISVIRGKYTNKYFVSTGEGT